ncbi:hypothetical protein [uncultured Maribacter sp.]|uniref:hypothetical protein n=1 Tax=uncultured Maribacter sp. TaxID=431308 RepID=UPI0030DD6DAB
MRKATSNTITESQHVSDVRLLFVQVKRPYRSLLLFADVPSYFLGEQVETLIIFSIIILSGFLSLWQKRCAQNIVQELLAIREVNIIDFKVKILAILPN